MATKPPPFEDKDWEDIRETLKKEPERFGLPARQKDSIVFASFNIRQLGKIKTGRSAERDDATFQFLADVCKHFDLLAVQEVLADTEGLLKLRELMGSDYGLVHSDVTGAFPGRTGKAERLAFIYNRKLVKRSELVSDVTYDRTEVVKRIADWNDELHEVLGPFAKERKTYRAAIDTFLRQGGKRPQKPKMGNIQLPGFLTFLRTPFAAGFRVHGPPGSKPYEFLAVNAHLNWGDDNDRIWEGRALLEWMLAKVKQGAKNKLNVVLFGDLNLVFEDPEKDLVRITRSIQDAAKLVGLKKIKMVMPFLFPHPNPRQRVEPAGSVFRTNVGLDETFDHLGAFYNDERLKPVTTRIDPDGNPGHATPEVWGAGPDYGVVNFSDLFSQALKGKSFWDLGQEERDFFVRRYQDRVSDHMPIWTRLPLP